MRNLSLGILLVGRAWAKTEIWELGPSSASSPSSPFYTLDPPHSPFPTLRVLGVGEAGEALAEGRPTNFLDLDFAADGKRNMGFVASENGFGDRPDILAGLTELLQSPPKRESSLHIPQRS